MSRIVLLASLALACTGCAPTPAPEAVVSGAAVTVAPGNPACRDYTAQVVVDGGAQKVVGHAYQLPDGSWRVAEGTPEQPNQTVFIYAAAAYPGNIYAPWFWGSPIGLSFGSLVFVDHRHQFRRFDRFHNFHHFDGFHRFHHFDDFHRLDGFHDFGRLHRFGGFGDFQRFGFTGFHHGGVSGGGWGGMAHSAMRHH